MVCEDCGMFGNLLERVRALFRHGGHGGALRPGYGHHYPGDVLPKPPRYPYGTRGGRGRAFDGESSRDETAAVVAPWRSATRTHRCARHSVVAYPSGAPAAA